MSENATRLPVAMIRALHAALGEEHVCTGPEELDRYSRCTIPWQSECAGVVFPASADEVSEVVKIAVQHGIPVWPFSTGRNWGYGATLAPESGALVMILQRMNRILEVNEELAYAVIEPGVTYEQFNAYLKENNHPLWVDSIDGHKQGSVIGNALERGIGSTPYGDHFGNLCGLEVVLPTGELIHTGGALSGSKTWHAHKWGVGPYIEGLFTQSNLGVVTRAGIWLMPEPEAFNSYVFEIRDEANLPQVLDAFRELALKGVVTTKLHMINDVVSLSILTQRHLEQEGEPDRALSAEELASLRKKYGISPWSCGGGIYGTRAQVRLQRRILRKALGRYGRLTFLNDLSLAVIKRLLTLSWKNGFMRTMVEKLSGTSLLVLDSAPYVHNILQGIPTDYFVTHAYFRNRRPRPSENVDPARDRCGLTWFAPILPFSPGQMVPYLDYLKEKMEASGFDFYMAMLLLNPRAVICLVGILYDKDDAQQAKTTRQLYDELLDDLYARKYQQYRAGLPSWGRVFEQAPELQQLGNRLKGALDPSNVLAPGRYGLSREKADVKEGA